MTSNFPIDSHLPQNARGTPLSIFAMFALKQSVLTQRSLSPFKLTNKRSIPGLIAVDKAFLRPQASFTFNRAVQFSASSTKIAPLLPRTFPSSGFESIDPSIKIEEETLSFYDPRMFYPVHLGEVFRECYQVVAKPGWGAHSTIWLCHDLQYANFPSLLISTSVSHF